jgi:hypothetical protein
MAGCASAEPLTADEASFCALMDEDELDVFADDVLTMSPAAFKTAQVSQADSFTAALDVAPAELEETIAWVVGQFTAINAVYDDIEWDLTRIADADPALLAVVMNQYPQEEADDRYRELDGWVDRHC